MYIHGKFDVTLTDKNGNITKKCGKNLITNLGKKHIINWLSHNCYSNSVYDNDVLSGGKSFNTFRIVPYNDILEKEYSENNSYYFVKDISNSMYAPNKSKDIFCIAYNANNSRWDNVGESEKRKSSLYFDFVDKKNINSIVMEMNSCDRYGDNGEGVQIEISTSEYSADEDKDWVIRKRMMLSTDSNYPNEYHIFLGDRNNPEKTIENVKSIRISPCYYGIKLYNILFYEYINYTMPPCFIGIGNQTKQPTSDDIDLGNRIALLQAKTSTNTGEIIYRARLGIKEFNDITFSEIGLFFIDDMFNEKLPYENQKIKLFSHGLFDESWKKTDEIVADIKYTITIGSE